jgi:hypothetical protein
MNPFVVILQKAQSDSDNIIFIRKQVSIVPNEYVLDIINSKELWT